MLFSHFWITNLFEKMCKKCTVWRPIIIINNNQIYNDMKNISISKKKKPIHQDRIAKKKEWIRLFIFLTLSLSRSLSLHVFINVDMHANELKWKNWLSNDSKFTQTIIDRHTHTETARARGKETASACM